MIDLLPEPKVVHEDGNKTKKFKNLWLKSEQGISEELIALSRERFWNYQEVKINETEENILEVMLVDSLDNIDSNQKELFQEQGLLNFYLILKPLPQVLYIFLFFLNL